MNTSQILYWETAICGESLLETSDLLVYKHRTRVRPSAKITTDTEYVAEKHIYASHKRQVLRYQTQNISFNHRF